MNNSVFGKMIENGCEHRDIKLVVTEERRKKLVSMSNFKSCTSLDENLMAIELRKTSVKMDRPIPVGQDILDNSKELMYEFYYDYLKVKYDDKVKLCYTDTDSFIIHIQTEDFFKDIANDVNDWFDTIKYDKNDNRPLPIGVNKKVIGMFKDELDGKTMLEFIALRAKVYAYIWQKDINQICEKKKCKGTKKCVAKKDLKFDHYKRALFNNEVIYYTQRRFKSTLHQIDTVNINKIALSNRDDKRPQRFDGITTYPIGSNPYIVCESEMQIALNNKHQLIDRHELINKIKDRTKLCDREKLDELGNVAIPMYY